MNFAPIIIPTLCRYNHLKRCIDSLAKCTNALNTPLFVFLDFPLKKVHESGYYEIKKYLKNVSGFKSLNIVERERNYGAAENAYEGIKYVLKLYDRIIILEDDNECSPNFLDYINHCLDKYQSNDEVLAVTGYNRMIEMSGYKFNIYAAISYSAWGVGYFKKDFEFLQNKVINKSYAESIIRSWKKSCRIYQLSPQLLQGLMSVVKTEHITGDTLVVSYMCLNQKYCIWPALSKVRNHGFDGGGEHFGSNLDHPLLKQEIDLRSTFEPDDIEIKTNELIKFKSKQYSNKQIPLLNKLIFGVYIPLRYLIYRLTGVLIYK